MFRSQSKPVVTGQSAWLCTSVDATSMQRGILSNTSDAMHQRRHCVPCGHATRPPVAPRPTLLSARSQRGSVLVAHAQTLARPAASAESLASIADISKLAKDTELKDLKARDVKSVSYVSRRRMDDADFDPNAVDEDGLPMVYNEAKIAQFWSKRPGELVGRWTRFTAISAPWLTKLANAVLQGKLVDRQVELARDAVDNLEKLGPTFVKLGQIMSIRPDVLPPPVMRELAKLQDRIEPFNSTEARAMIEADLGAPLDELFSEFSEKPIAAASLAQVYRARLRSNGELVAVKVQRPAALATISKDLYVMRRAVGMYEQIVRRFTAQTTDYQELVSTFAEGLYTELDFRNEALNAQRMRQLLDESEFKSADVIIPSPYMEYTTRRVLTMEWVDGVKLTTLPPDEVRTLVKVGQAAFLTQLLEIGFIHGDPHPGNLLRINSGPNAGKLALLDFGLVAEIPSEDREAMVSATIHLANRDWDALITDFVSLGFLPADCDRGLITPVMERVLGPYLRGGGAKAFNFSALSQDLLAATLEIPFSVPPYMSLLARSVATLEGIALVGDPNYQMVAQAYPFVVRKILRNDSTGTGSLLRDILYDADGNVKPTRMSALLNAALGYVSDRTDGFVDFDAVPDDGASVQEVFQFLLSPEARDLRPLLVSQLSTGLDLLLRDRVRKLYTVTLPSLVPRLPFLGALPTPPLPPVLVPGRGLMPVPQALDLLAPPLSGEEAVFLNSLLELTAALTGLDQSDLDNPSPQRVVQLLSSPTEQLRELTGALEAVATGRGSGAQKPAAASSAAVPQPSASHSPVPGAVSGNGKAAGVSVGHSVEGVEGSSVATSLGSSFDETIYDDSTATTAGVDGAASSSSSSSSTSAATAEPASSSSSSSGLERAAETRQVIVEVATSTLDLLAERQAERAGIPAATLFPLLPLARQLLQGLPNLIAGRRA